MKKEELEDYLKRKNEKIWEDAKKFIQKFHENFEMTDTDNIIIREKND